MFDEGKTELQAIASHNKNKEAGKFQEGGTAIIVYRDSIQQYNPAESGRDDLCLGRWMHMKFKGDKKISTRVICGYSPCMNKKKNLGTVYQQHHRHLINTLTDDTCPQAQFRVDLLRQLKRWHKDREHLILCMDANKNIYQGKLGQQLMELHGLGMKEVVGDFTTKQLGAAYFQRCGPIDAIWATSNITMANACMMLVGYGVRDHHLFVVDFATGMLVGTGSQKIV
jgi:hypothetical protein